MAVCFATYRFGDSVAYLGTPAAVDAVAARLRQQCPDVYVEVTHADLSSRDCKGCVLMHA